MTDSGRGRKSSIEAEFDAKAREYESNRLAPWYKSHARFVLDHIDTLEGVALDVGCGTGWLLRKLVSDHPGASGVGIDLSEKMVETAGALAEAEGLDALEFIRGDWEAESTQEKLRDRLPHGADLVVCASVFHYFERPGRALEAMKRSLAPGGTLLLLERCMDGSLATRIWDFLHRYVIRDHVRFYRTESMIDLLREAGLRHVQVLGRLQRAFWQGKLYTSLVLISAEKT